MINELKPMSKDVASQEITIRLKNPAPRVMKAAKKKAVKRCNDAPQNRLSGENPKIRVNPNETANQCHKRFRTMQRALAAYGRYGLEYCIYIQYTSWALDQGWNFTQLPEQNI